VADHSTSAGGGAGFASLLTVLFIGLKLTGHIAWSWWWILSPLWITAGVVLAIILIMLAVIDIMDYTRKKKRRF
jgi:hypothetical protein